MHRKPKPPGAILPLTEAEWLASRDPWMMTMDLRDKGCGRKLRLYAVAVCRALWPDADQGDAGQLLQAAEAHAEGQLDEWTLAKIVRRIGPLPCYRGRAIIGAADAYTSRSRKQAGHAAAVVALVELGRVDWHKEHPAAWAGLADLLRHFFPNPLAPMVGPPSWPAPIAVLAEAVYGGDQTAAGPLQDALLDAGFPELAAHFHTEVTHLRGCWAVDLILGKQ